MAAVECRAAGAALAGDSQGQTVRDAVNGSRAMLPRAMLLPTPAQQAGGRRQVLELGVGFLEGNFVVLAGREAAIGVEVDPFGGDVSERFLHALRYDLRRLDLGKTDIHA